MELDMGTQISHHYPHIHIPDGLGRLIVGHGNQPFFWNVSRVEGVDRHNIDGSTPIHKSSCKANPVNTSGYIQRPIMGEPYSSIRIAESYL